MFPLRDSRTSGAFPFITIGLIAVNAYVFFTEITSANTDAFINTYALVPGRVNFGNWITLLPFITSQFLHAGFLHILSNMWFLRIFGDNVEERLGGIMYLFVYLLAGTVGGVLQYTFSPASAIPMLGASGAVAGILGAYFVFFPHHKVETLLPLGFFITTVDVSAQFMLFYWFIIQLFSGVGSVAVAQIGGTAFWAHVGGFLTGYFIAKLYSGRGEAEEGEILD